MKNIADFYYVEVGDALIECKPRGIFRKSGVTPLVGDMVTVTIGKDGKGMIEEIAKRKNSLARPPLANLDKLFIVSSLSDPKPNAFVIDTMTVFAEDKSIEPVIVINKCDLSDDDSIIKIYEDAGFRVIKTSVNDHIGLDELTNSLKGCTSAFTGNSGVGKSSLLNCIDARFQIKTADISKKLGRGKHTTRHTELYKIQNGYIADTPGFSSIENEKLDFIQKENLQFCFREFAPYITKCKYTSCSHTKEKGCVIIDAVELGTIPKSRYESFLELYRQAEKINDWERD